MLLLRAYVMASILFPIRIMPRLFWYGLRRPSVVLRMPSMFWAYTMYLRSRMNGLDW